MDLVKAPFNLDLLSNNRSFLKNFTPVTSTDIFEGKSKQLHKDSLFSPDIFGPVGSEKRLVTFSYVDLKTQILHPILFNNLEKIATLYVGICNGTKYATWDDKKKIFVESNAVDGDTGFSFFMKYFKEIKFERNDSAIRNLRIDVLDKYRTTAVYDFVLVIPAGLRDLEEDKRGKLSQDEVNDFYRNLISLSKNIDTTYKDNKFNDGTKMLMQHNFNSIYNLIYNYLGGKGGLVQNKWGKRKLENGTRSVLSPMNTSVEDMKGAKALRVTDIIVGLHQICKANLPLIQNGFKQPLVSTSFTNNGAIAIDPKTKAFIEVSISSKFKETFTTDDGVNELLNKFEHLEFRHRPIKLGKGYLAYIYKDDVGFKIVKDISTVPESKLDKLTPLTYAELLYYIALPLVKRNPVWATRFPIEGENSTIPNLVYVKTTEVGEELREYDHNWELTDNIYPEFPIEGSTWVDTIAVHPSKLSGLGADFDGDTGSVETTKSDEAIKELEAYYDDPENWFVEGKVTGFGSTDTIELVFKSMSA